MMDPIVETTYGRVQGQAHGGVLSFRDVPYGFSTAGEGRFKAPRPPIPWSGVREARDPIPLAYQSTRRPGGRPDAVVPMTEDCLTLNVWTSSLSGRRPVLVWFHGGGFVAGNAVTAESDGVRLAARDDVVTVNVTHRLGMLGFLDLEEIGGDAYKDSGNAGALDMRLALLWVRDNIDRFGGDPNAVTIHGHSGGGGKVALLASMPSARGLFRSAAMHGGPPFGFKDHATAADSAEQVLTLLGIPPSRLSALADVPIERLIDVQEQLGTTGMPGPHGMRFAPVVGTAALPADPYHAFAAGYAADVEFMTGTSLDEARAAISAFPHYLTDPDMTDRQLRRRIRPGLDNPEDADVLIDRYRAVLDAPTNTEIFFAILSDQFTVRSMRLADAKRSGDGHPSWLYLCTSNQRSPLRSFHGIQMPLFFDNVDASTPGAATASPVSSELVRFAAGEIAGSDVWRAYTKDTAHTLVIDDETVRCELAPLADRVTAWNGVVLTPRTDPWTTLWQ